MPLYDNRVHVSAMTMLYIQIILFLEKSQNIDFKDYRVYHTFIINDKHRRYERISSIPDLILVREPFKNVLADFAR